MSRFKLMLCHMYYKKNFIYIRQKSVGNDKNLWVIKNYPQIIDDIRSVCNKLVGKLPMNFWSVGKINSWVIHTNHHP